MRIVDLELVFRDGSTPVVKTPAAQSTALIKGEDVTYRLTCLNEAGAARNISGHTFLLGLTHDAAGKRPIAGFPRIGSIVDAPTGVPVQAQPTPSQALT